MDALKLVSSIGNSATFGNSSPEIEVEIEEEHHDTEIRIDTPENKNNKKRKAKKVSVLHPPDGGKNVWRMVVACSFLSVCEELLRNLIRHSDGFADDVGKDLVKDIVILYDGFSKFGGVFAAILAIRYGYRIVGIIGTTVASGGLIVASFVPGTSVDLRNLIAFLVSFVSGTASGFIRYVILIVVLEYFTTKRVKALIITSLGATVVSVAFTTLQEVKAHNPKVKIPWRQSFLYQGVVMAAAVIASAVIRTLDLDPEPEMKKSRHHHLQYSDFSPKNWRELLKDMTFYLYVVFYLFFDLGEHLPNVGDLTKSQAQAFDSDQILASKYVPHMGFVCALIPMCFWKNQKLSNILVVLGPINFIAGLATCVILSYMDFGLIVFYGIFFAVASHCILWMMLDVLPDEFGRNNTRITLGVISFISGATEVGSAYAREAAESYVADPNEEFRAVFILSGSLIMVSGIWAVFIRCLIVLYKDPESRRKKEEA